MGHGGSGVGWGGGLWTEECVTSVWLSVQCLQETNFFLSFFIGGKKEKVLTVTHNYVDIQGTTRGGWEVARRHLLHPSKG